MNCIMLNWQASAIREHGYSSTHVEIALSANQQYKEQWSYWWIRRATALGAQRV